MAARLPDGAAPQIDGRLDDEVWTAAPVFSNFIQREPIVGAPSTERTEFRVLYDDAKLYFAHLGVRAASRRHRRQRNAA